MHSEGSEPPRPEATIAPASDIHDRWSIRDGPSRYGWISIALHWITACLILLLLFVGNSIRNAQGNLQDDVLRLHTSIGLTVYVLLIGRIVWRVKVGHPGPLPRQKPISYRVGKVFHYVLLAAIGLMLVSGPVMAWAGHLPLRLFDLILPAPSLLNSQLFTLSRTAHVAAATVLGWGALIHLVAVIKHATIDRDGTLDKIMVPSGPADTDLDPG